MYLGVLPVPDPGDIRDFPPDEVEITVRATVEEYPDGLTVRPCLLVRRRGWFLGQGERRRQEERRQH